MNLINLLKGGKWKTIEWGKQPVVLLDNQKYAAKFALTKLWIIGLFFYYQISKEVVESSSVYSESAQSFTRHLWESLKDPHTWNYNLLDVNLNGKSSTRLWQASEDKMCSEDVYSHLNNSYVLNIHISITKTIFWWGWRQGGVSMAY